MEYAMIGAISFTPLYPNNPFTSVNIVFETQQNIYIILKRSELGINAQRTLYRHEITGIVIKVGSNVGDFKIGERVGVGYMAASCLNYNACNESQETYCDKMQCTFNGVYWDGSPAYGGFSKMIVAQKRFVVHIPNSLPLDFAAPLLCTGITVFSPMKQHNMLGTPGKKLGVVGLGGPRHVAVKFGKAFGLHVTVISTSPSKEKEARERLGVDDFL